MGLACSHSMTNGLGEMEVSKMLNEKNRKKYLFFQDEDSGHARSHDFRAESVRD